MVSAILPAGRCLLKMTVFMSISSLPNKAILPRSLRSLDLRFGASRLHYGRKLRRYT